MSREEQIATLLDRWNGTDGELIALVEMVARIRNRAIEETRRQQMFQAPITRIRITVPGYWHGKTGTLHRIDGDIFVAVLDFSADVMPVPVWLEPDQFEVVE